MVLWALVTACSSSHSGGSVASCTNNDECLNGQACRNGACVSISCTTSAQCFNGQTCTNGVCMANGGGSGTNIGGSSSGGGSGSTGGSSSGSGIGAGAASMCPDNIAFIPEPYAAPKAHQGACDSTGIAAFITACASVALNDPTCAAWLVSNVAGLEDGGGAGTTCGNCIFAPDNNGGVHLDPNLELWPNYAGCVAIEDPKNGATCAPADQSFFDCVNQQCDDCATQSAANSCATAASQGICSSETTTADTNCQPDIVDGGALNTCSSASLLTDYQYIVQLICGN